MIQSGLVSVSFRDLSVEKICELAARARLAGIEWGGDIHVPSGDLGAARIAKTQTRDAGLAVAAYGSYYRAGTGEDFAPVLATAAELGAPSIRVWAGKDAAHCASQRAEIVADLNRITRQAAACNIVVATEYHSGTLTETAASAAQMLHETAATPLETLWQPPVFEGENATEENLASLCAVRSRLLNVHVYYWTQRDGEIQRQPLREGRAQWARYFAELRGHSGFALLEFVCDDAPENLLDDARALHELLAEIR